MSNIKQLLRNPKFKNPVFWTSLIAIMFASAGVDFNSLTSWHLLGEAILHMLNNPVSVTAVIVVVVGIFNDNSTKGIDMLAIEDEEDKW